MTLEELRKRLSEVDRELIGLVAARQKIIAEIGAHKIQNAVPTRDYEREREVLKGAQRKRDPRGSSRSSPIEIMQLLIRASLTHQEQTRVAAGTSGAGKRVLIIGGAGKMGAWFAHFLSSQGFAVEIADPSPAAVAFPRIADWRDNALDHDLIVVATPMKVAGDVLTELAARRPRGVVVDIGSLEEPAARRARAAGGGRLQGHVDSSDVRARHAAACRAGTSCSATSACPKPRRRRAPCSLRRWPSKSR